MSEKSAARREIDKQLSFALYGAANRMIRMHKPFLEPLGLTFPQYLVMVELLGSSPRSVGELGTRVGMDTGTITPLLKRLEKSGLVTRQREARDERKVAVEVTPAGAALRDRIYAVPDQINSACKITDARADEIREGLETMGLSVSAATD
jgi:DNA-binding MarR family transcriptional regulator